MRLQSIFPIVLSLVFYLSIGLPQLASADADTETTAKADQEVAEKSEPADEPSIDEESADKQSESKKDKSAPKKETKAKQDSDKSAEAKSKSDDKKKQAKKTADVKRTKGRFALFVLKDELPESPGKEGPFGDMQTDLRVLIERLDKASKDDSIRGIVLEIRNPSIGFGKQEELRNAIKRIRKSGKKVYARLETAMPADYLVACACDEIVMPESGVMLFPGIHAETTYYKGLLGKLGIEADFMHIGAYKAAAEPLTEEKMSPPVRENLTEVIDDIFDQMIVTVASERQLTVEKVKEAIDVGLLTASRAHELGLVDRIEYDDEFREYLGDSYHADPVVYVVNYGKKDVDTDFSGPMGFVKLMQVMMGAGKSSGSSQGKEIAIVYAVGPIVTGESEQDPFGGSVMGSSTIVEALREANEDKNVVAIVLRIDSPGGSAIASDLIWRETQRIEKPIVASMSDVAASGGYYIAMGADKIYAAPATITGSIGVVSGKLALRGLYDKVGLTTDTIQRGRNSGMFSASGKFSESEREVMWTFMEDIYGQFTAKAAEGRDMPLERLKDLAGGRIYTGRQAKRLGLVDDIGTLEQAIDSAKELAGLKSSDKVRLKLLPEPVNFFESLFGNMDSEKEVTISLGLEKFSPELAKIAQRAYRLQLVFREPAAFILPFELDIKY